MWKLFLVANPDQYTFAQPLFSVELEKLILCKKKTKQNNNIYI